MKVGAFELYEPLPELRNAQAFTMLSPWIDVGGVGSSTLRLLESHFKASELGKLRRPGMFYDFTRYRPMVSLEEGRRVISISNTFINYSQGGESGDFVFLHCLEPHMMGEVYVESVLKVLERLNVTRYCLLGGMYDSVPHTKPLIVTGSASESSLEGKLSEANVKASRYQGPTTINILISEQAAKYGIETLTLIVHLPHYVRLEEDYNGQYALLSLICHLYNLPIGLDEIKHMGDEQYQRISLVCHLYNLPIGLDEIRHMGDEQYQRISSAVEANSEARELVRAMEESYDEGLEETKPPERMPRLSPDVQRFLREMEKRFDSS